MPRLRGGAISIAITGASIGDYEYPRRASATACSSAVVAISATSSGASGWAQLFGNPYRAASDLSAVTIVLFGNDGCDAFSPNTCADVQSGGWTVDVCQSARMGTCRLHGLVRFRLANCPAVLVPDVRRLRRPRRRLASAGTSTGSCDDGHG